MSTNIEWTNETWNPLVGCKMVSPGCANCYAETMSDRLAGMAKADKQRGVNPGRKEHYLAVMTQEGKWNGAVRFVPEALGDPFKWKKPRRIFVNSMSDLFHEGMPFEYIDQVFSVMALCPQHTFQILTKRPERMAAFFNRSGVGVESLVATLKLAPAKMNLLETGLQITGGQWDLANVWLGTSVENQKTADERIQHLLQCPAAVRFLSCEPLLGSIDLRNLNLGIGENIDEAEGDAQEFTFDSLNGTTPDGSKIHWVIVGGESGPGARPTTIGHIREIVRQCQAAGVPVFVKQLGSRPVNREGAAHPAKDNKGGDIDEFPADLRVREFPARKDVANG